MTTSCYRLICNLYTVEYVGLRRRIITILFDLEPSIKCPLSCFLLWWVGYPRSKSGLQSFVVKNIIQKLELGRNKSKPGNNFHLGATASIIVLSNASFFSIILISSFTAASSPPVFSTFTMALRHTSASVLFHTSRENRPLSVATSLDNTENRSFSTARAWS